MSGLGDRHTVRTSIGDVDYHVRGSGRTMVFVHGLLANAVLWSDVVSELAAGYRCVCVDLPLGSHRLAADPDAELTPATVASALAEVLEAVAPDGAVLVANDTGGVLAQIVATTTPERLDGLVLTPCDLYANFLPWMLRYIQVLARVPGGVWLMATLLRFGWLRRLPIAYGWLVRRLLTPQEWDSFLRPATGSPAVRRDLGKFLRAISTRYTRGTAQRLPEFEKPTLFAWADTHRIFPVAHARRLAGSMPDAEVRAVPDSYAFLPMDKPAALSGLIDEFVSTRLGAAR
ncbi:MAG: alpha/beta fold hydrolase [Micromonosporaceae bacterium]